MPPQMTSTAYGQGAKNALACGAGFLVIWLLTGGAIWQATGKPIFESFGLGFGLLWGFVFVWFVATWLYGRQSVGRRLHLVGPGKRPFVLSTWCVACSV